MGAPRGVRSRRRGLPFLANYGYIQSNPLVGRKAGQLSPNSKETIENYVARRRNTMDQVIEQVEQQVVELSLAELAQVGGGALDNSLC